MPDSGEPFIEQGGIYIVPTVPQRLSFAVLVQRAFERLELTADDVVAVALPPSLEIELHYGIAELPRVSLITGAVEAEVEREVFPVTPCDGMVEAVRTAAEKGLKLRLVDREVTPGALIERSCFGDPDWPDDGLVLQ